LGPNVDEALAGDAVWTETPPEGWSIDESGIPGIGMDATDGMTEWAGWAFADKAWWIEAAEDQRRSEFTLGEGTVAVADPDEWDDGERLPIPISADPYDTWLTTPSIDIADAEAGTLQLKFDSSWRPEFDDNYHQTASITASFDGGEPIEVLRWESDSGSLNFKDDNSTNDTIVVDLQKPEGARKVVLTFGLFDAGNDWWWAIDNIEVRAVVPEPVPVAPGTDGLLAYYALDGDPNDSSGNGIHGIIHNAETGGLGDGGSVWVEDPERGTVISFNGTADGAHVRAGEIPQMTLTNDFTWAFWAKQKSENTADNDIIFGNRMDENAVDFVPRQFIKFTPTKFEWHMNGNGDDNMEYDDIPADVWLHHAVVKTADQLTYYRNGVKASTGTITQPLDVPQPLFFGGDNEGSAGENWNGLMSDACVYDRALSAGEVMFLADLRATPVNPGTNGLVAFYALDGDTNDSSGNELHGTIVGEPAFVEGPIGMALELDGVDDHVNLGNPPALDFGTGDFTISAWVNLTTTERATVYAKGGDNSGGIRYTLAMGEANDNRMTLTTDDDSTKRQALGSTVVNDGEWHHVVGMRSGDTTLVFVDGDKDGAIDVPEGYDLSGSSQANALIGAITDARDATGATLEKFYTGILDEVAIYDRALSGGEIRYLAGFRSETLTGLSDITVVDDAIVSVRYKGTEYVVADGDLILGTTTRWYVLEGVETLWAEGDPTAPQTVGGSSNPKDGDVGSKADNFLFKLDGSTNISSIDGIDFQQTIFPSLVDTIIVFERNGNDVGSFQAIDADGSLGEPIEFVKSSDGGPYADTGIDVNGQNAYGVVFKTSVPVQGVRITASGHDTLSISAVAP
jgi:hypothetical protein